MRGERDGGLSPKGSQKKFACESGTSGTSSLAPMTVRLRSEVTSATRRRISPSASSAASAARCAAALTAKGITHLLTAPATSGVATM